MADSRLAQRTGVVYWLFDETCICPRWHGYVGITSVWPRPLWRHKKRQRFPPNFSHAFLFRGIYADCRKLEWELRPDRFIGWNRGVGGGKGRLGVKASAASKQRMSEAAKRKPPISAETREKLRIASTGRTNRGRVGQCKSDEERQKISHSHRGKVLSREHLAKLMAARNPAAHLGHRHSRETKERIRQKKLGVPIHSDEEKRRRADKWKGNSLTKGKPWSAARRLAWLSRKEADQA